MKMEFDPVYTSFLKQQFQEGMALQARSDLLRLIPMPSLASVPIHYMAEFRCIGLAQDPTGEVVEWSRWGVGIHFPPNYLRGPVHASHVLTFLGVGGRPDLEPMHPNIRPPFICLEITPGMRLTEILFALHDLLTWNLYQLRDEGLNHSAAQWARHQPADRFPIDARPLGRRSRTTARGELEFEVIQ